MTPLGHAGLILSVGLILRLLGPLDEAPEAVGIASGLLAWARGAARRRREADGTGRPAARAGAWLPAVAGVPLLLAIDAIPPRLGIVAAIVAATPGPSRACGTAFVAAALSWRLLAVHVPWFLGLEVELSRLLSGWLGLMTGQRLDLGPSASGLGLLALFLIHAAASRRPGSPFLWARAGAASAAVCIYMSLLPALGRSATQVPLDVAGVFNRAREHLAPTPQGVARVMCGWTAALFVPLCAIFLRRPAAPAPARRGMALPATALSAALLVALAAPAWPAGARRSGDVVILRSPAFDMEAPAAGRYGAAQAGMFGLLPRYLGLDGHTARLLERPAGREALRAASVVMVVLPAAPFSGEERSALESFVRDGGSLLVMGDHTDLLGTQRPINELVGPWGIRVRFDSAFPTVREWSGCLDGARLVRGRRTGIGTGASLQIRGLVRPLVLGRYALSDAGDRSNAGRGANLGNYAYDAGEQLGDLVLVAALRLGLGRVVVFGDTSSFQNLMLPSSHPFVSDLVDDLSRPRSRARDLADLAAGLAAALLGVLALAGSKAAVIGLPAAVLASAAVSCLAAGPSPIDRLPPDVKVALIDAAHLNDYARELWHEDSIGGLIVSLQRNGYLPLMVEEGFARLRAGTAALPVLAAARSPLKRKEALALARHLESGGDVLVAAGGPDAKAVAPLLSMYGISIGRTPLGPVPLRPDLDRAAFDAARKEAQFREAWPVQSAGVVASRSLYRAFDRDVVLEVRSRAGGGGRLLVIGDPDFLTDRVLENEHGEWEGNVTLLGRLLARRDPP